MEKVEYSKSEIGSCWTRVCEILREDCGVAHEMLLIPELSLQGDLGLDSIAMLNLIVALEDSYDIRLDNVITDAPSTLKGVVEMILDLRREVPCV